MNNLNIGVANDHDDIGIGINRDPGVCNKKTAWIILITVILSTVITLVLVFAVTWPYFQTSLNRLEQKVEDNREQLKQINVRV